jgi:hypothetical protein
MSRLLGTALVAAAVSLAVTTTVLRRRERIAAPAQGLNPNYEAFLDRFVRLQAASTSPVIPAHLQRRVEDAARKARAVLEQYEQSGPRVAP